MKSLKDFNEVKVIYNDREARDIYGGVSAKVIAEVDGKRVMIKRSDRDIRESLCEYVAHKLGNLMGLKTNEVELINGCESLGFDGTCSMHTWEKLFVEKSGIWSKTEYMFEYGLNENAVDEDHSIMRLFDIIIDNEDRHGHNWGWINGEMFLIDHETSYPWFLADDNHKRKLNHHLNNMMSKRLFKTAVNFYHIDVEDFYEAFQIPAYVEKELDDDTVIDRIITRMIEMQDVIGEKLRLKQLVA